MKVLLRPQHKSSLLNFFDHQWDLVTVEYDDDPTKLMIIDLNKSHGTTVLVCATVKKLQG